MEIKAIKLHSFLPACALIAALPLTTLVQAQNAPSATPVAANPNVDPAALALLDQSQAKLASIKTIRANYVDMNWYPSDARHKNAHRSGGYYDFVLARPNLAVVRIGLLDRSEPNGPLVAQQSIIVDHSDGKTLYNIIEGSYRKEDPDVSSLERQLGERAPLSGFFDPALSEASLVRHMQKQGDLISLRLLGTQVWDSIAYQPVEVTFVPDTP